MKKRVFRSPVRRMSVLLFAMFMVLAAPFAMAGQEGDRGEAGSTKKEEAQPISPFLQAMGGRERAAPSKVYSNDDLEKMFGGPKQVTLDLPAAGSPAAPQAGAADGAEQTGGTGQSPLDQVLAEEKAREEQRVKITQAEKKIVEAEQRVKDLERATLAQRNPFLSRPAPPEDEDERAAYESADNAGRVAITDQRLEAAREALTKAREELATLRSSVP